jgi:hypothetical protein
MRTGSAGITFVDNVNDEGQASALWTKTRNMPVGKNIVGGTTVPDL